MELSQQQILINHLDTLSVEQIFEDQSIRAKFICLYNSVHKTNSGDVFYEKESYNLQKLLFDKPEIKQCTKLSIYGCFLDIAVNGLSFESGNKPLVYITSRNVNVGSQQQPSWQKRAEVKVSPYGELLLRVKTGQIAHADNPVIVYDGDFFEPYIDDHGNKSIRFQMKAKERKVCVGAFIKLTRLDKSFDYQWLSKEEITRLRGYSHRQNKGDTTNDKSNSLYTSHHGGIDPGFLAAKMIKHAFSTYPKVMIGKFSTLETNDENANEINYDLNPTNPSAKVPESTKKEQVEPFGAVPEDNKVQPTTTVQDDIF